MSLFPSVEKQLQGLGRYVTAPFSQQQRRPLAAPDYVAGFIIEQMKGAKRRLVLNGTNLPHQPFEFGGRSRISKQWYPGNSEPTMQVLGSEETSVTINGRFYSKRYAYDSGLYAVPKAISEMLLKMRAEGEIVRITLGEWVRFALISECSFKEKHKGDIEYRVTFDIISKKTPAQCYQITNRKDTAFKDNDTLANKAAEFQAKYANPSPATVDQTFADRITDYVDQVASSIANVNAFVNRVITQAENIEAAAIRAIGLIKVARNNISNAMRRIGALSYAVSGKSVTMRYNTVSTSSRLISDMAFLTAILAKLQEQFESIRRTTPRARYRVQEGDTLQAISVKFYGNAENWSRIYDHNKLTTTALTKGAVLEIPNL